MSKAKTILIVAGEHSGDALGAPLIEEILAHYPNTRFIGVGGEMMEQAGLKSLFPLSDLALMGLVEIIPHIPNLFKRMDQLVKTARTENIDLLITIDAPDFNLRLAKRIKNQFNVPCVHYVSPSVWAWRQKRARKMAEFIDHVLSLLPFEPSYYQNVGLPCTYVGHPAYERLKGLIPHTITPPQDLKLALLPGSRAGELNRHSQVMCEAFSALKQDLPTLEGILVLPNDDAREHLPPLHEDITVVTGEKRFQALSQCRAALAKSGTGNLELAILGVPHVVGYKVNALTWFIAKLIIDVPYVSLTNWIAEKKIAPEFLQHDMTAETMVNAVRPWLTDDATWQTNAQELATVRSKLQSKVSPSKLAFQAIQHLL